MNPKISVIIPVYNLEKYLRQCLDCVVNQTLKDIEIICVDDGSTDSSLDILKEYGAKDNRFVILQQENKRAGAARNAGLEIAKGDYLSFLDGDDLFDLNMLEQMYNKAEKDKSDTVICEFYEYDSETNVCGRRSMIRYTYSSKSPFSPRTFVNNVFCFSSSNAWTKLFRRKMFVDNNIRFSTTVCCNDLAAVCLALACSNKISIINTPFIKYRVNQTKNLTASRNKSVDSFFNAIKDLQNNLKRLNLYKVFENAYRLRICASHKWELSLCNEEQKEERKRVAKEILPDDIYFMLYDERK